MYNLLALLIVDFICLAFFFVNFVKLENLAFVLVFYFLWSLIFLIWLLFEFKFLFLMYVRNKILWILFSLNWIINCVLYFIKQLNLMNFILAVLIISFILGYYPLCFFVFLFKKGSHTNANTYAQFLTIYHLIYKLNLNVF